MHTDRIQKVLDLVAAAGTELAGAYSASNVRYI